MPNQYNWFWCNKCNGLVYGGDPYSNLFEIEMGNIGVCAAGGTHYLGASLDYSISYGEASTSTLQADWYWCQKCQGIWWHGNPSAASHCPAGGQHDHTSSYDYDLLHSIPLTTGQQNNWRWCNKCQGVFYAANSTLGPGPCPDGGTHNDGGSWDYHLLIPAVTKPLAPADLVPKNGATGVSTDPYFSWSDPGAGTPAQAGFAYWIVSQGGVIVGPGISPGRTQATIISPGAKWFSTLPSGAVNLEVWFINAAGSGPASSTNFNVT